MIHTGMFEYLFLFLLFIKRLSIKLVKLFGFFYCLFANYFKMLVYECMCKTDVLCVWNRLYVWKLSIIFSYGNLYYFYFFICLLLFFTLYPFVVVFFINNKLFFLVFCSAGNCVYNSNNDDYLFDSLDPC